LDAHANQTERLDVYRRRRCPDNSHAVEFVVRDEKDVASLIVLDYNSAMSLMYTFRSNTVKGNKELTSICGVRFVTWPSVHRG
jgi:hypothetical protein